MQNQTPKRPANALLPAEPTVAEIPAARKALPAVEPTVAELPAATAEKAPLPSEPSVTELATLAVALDGITKSNSPTESFLPHALDLWLKARGVLETWRANPASVFTEPTPATPPPPPPLSEPKRFPVKLDEFLRLMIPELKGDTYEQNAVFREFLKYYLYWNKHFPTIHWANDDPLGGLELMGKHITPTKQEIDDELKRLRENPMDRWEYHFAATAFRTWFVRDYPATKQKKVSQGKTDNALKMHARARLRRYLWENSCKADPHLKVGLKAFPKVTDEQMARLLALNQGRPLVNYRDWDYSIDRTG